MNLDKTVLLTSGQPSARISAEPGQLDSALDNIYRLFGADAVLIPVLAETAKNMSVDCLAMTAEQTQASAYQARLKSENIAVACVDGLHALFFVTVEVQAEFMAANPPLRHSLLTSGPLGTVLWLRCRDAVIPGPGVAPGCLCWIGPGGAMVVSGSGPLASSFKILRPARPIEVAFDSIRWPEPMRVQVILHEVLHQCGSYATRDPQNRIRPNWDYWARVFSLVHVIQFDLARELFTRVPSGHELQELQCLSPERVLGLISDFLSHFGRQPRFAVLLKYRQARFLKEFLFALKIVTAPSREPKEDLETFLATTLEACPGADVSSAELLAAQVQYFQAKRLPPYPTSIFQKRVSGRIEQLFRGIHSKSVERQGKLCRGYKHVRLKT